MTPSCAWRRPGKLAGFPQPPGGALWMLARYVSDFPDIYAQPQNINFSPVTFLAFPWGLQKRWLRRLYPLGFFQLQVLAHLCPTREGPRREDFRYVPSRAAVDSALPFSLLCLLSRLASHLPRPPHCPHRVTLWNGGQEQSSYYSFSSTAVQFSSVAQLCPTLCHPMDCSTPGFPVHRQFRTDFL